MTYNTDWWEAYSLNLIQLDVLRVDQQDLSRKCWAWEDFYLWDRVNIVKCAALSGGGA